VTLTDRSAHPILGYLTLAREGSDLVAAYPSPQR